VQLNPKPRLGRSISEQPRDRPVLCHHQVHAPIPIQIPERRAALIAKNVESAFRSVHRRESTIPVTTQPKSTPGIVSFCGWIVAEEILTEKHIFLSAPIQISHANGECRSPLRFLRKIRKTMMMNIISATMN
jgi:hypothetical protein